MLRVDASTEIFYRVDDFTDPWAPSDAVFLVHGAAESGEAWFAWVPHLARRFRLVRPDVRGYGRSTAMPLDHRWSLERIADDFAALADHLAIERFHLVAAKVGGMMGIATALRHPDRVISLAVLGTPIEGVSSVKIGYSGEEIEQRGVGHWAKRTMKGRLGSRLPPAAHDWWLEMMARTASSTHAGFLRFLARIDLSDRVAGIRCPTLVVTTGDPDGPSQSITSLEVVRSWQERIPGSRLSVIPDDSYHVAASAADAAAAEVAGFLRAHATTAQSRSPQ